MKSTMIQVLIVSAFASSAFAADPVKQTAEVKDAGKAEMMQKWQAYATPGPQHAKLKELVGKYEYTSTMWESPKAKPEKSKGTSNMEMVYDRFLKQEFKGQAMGQPFEGMGFVGYDNVKQKYTSTWFDSMGTGMYTSTGTFDESAKAIKETGEGSCPMSDSKTRSFRSEWKLKDKNNMTFTMWTPDMKTGKEFKQLEIKYKRVM